MYATVYSKELLYCPVLFSEITLPQPGRDAAIWRSGRDVEEGSGELE